MSIFPGVHLENEDILRHCYSGGEHFLAEMGFMDVFWEAGDRHTSTGHNWHLLTKIILMIPRQFHTKIPLGTTRQH